MTDTKNPAKVAAVCRAQNVSNWPANDSTPPLRFEYPEPDTLPALPLALMIQGRKVSTLDMTYSPVHATRLPAYIGRLRDFGLGDAIIARPLPLTAKQRQRKRSKPFYAYHLPPETIRRLGDYAQEWAAQVLEQWEVDPDRFPFSEDWLRGCA